MMIATGATAFYFETGSNVQAIAVIGKILLTPAFLADSLAGSVMGFDILGHSMRMFLVLWITFFAIGYRMSEYLIVTNHKAADLKSWYRNRLLGGDRF